MSWILNIDTALSTASVCLSENGKPSFYAENIIQKDHSSWLHTAIKELINKSGIDNNQLDAVCANIGPGSYTGLRVSLSAAKGVCYALNIPLITVNSLELAAFAVQQEATDIICATIDARRMEIYSGTFDKEINILREPSAIVVRPDSFDDLLNNHNVLFCGDGNYKLRKIICHANAMFSDTDGNAKQMAEISFRRFSDNIFSHLANTDPLYLKDSYSTSG